MYLLSIILISLSIQINSAQLCKQPIVNKDSDGLHPLVFGFNLEDYHKGVRKYVNYNGFLGLKKAEAFMRGGDQEDVFVWQVKSSNGDFEYCKIICLAGRWVGPVCRLDVADITEEEYDFNCILPLVPRYLEIREDHTLIKQLTEKVLGPSRITCKKGRWDHSLPFCTNTSSRTVFDESLPPAIQWTVSSGSELVGRGGELVVSPGARVVLDCIIRRSSGTPEWEWDNMTKESKEYLTGWATSAPDTDWVYRLELERVTVEESGEYRCTSQRGYTNTLVLLVTDLQCHGLPVYNSHVHSNISGPSHNIGTVVELSCPPGYNIQGDTASTCRDDGTWSGGDTWCDPVQCPPLEIVSTHLRTLSLNNSYQGQAVFHCPFGYRLTGRKTLTCGETGAWSGLVPDCQAILCPAPAPPSHGSLALGAREVYHVGASVQWRCEAGHVMVGEPLTTCTHLGVWSYSSPSCITACAYPGSPLHGLISPVKFVYEVGEEVRVECDAGYFLSSSARLECSQEGKWSSPVPICEDE